MEVSVVSSARYTCRRARGLVVAADTGQPLPKVQVRLFSAGLRDENRLAVTDGLQCVTSVLQHEVFRVFVVAVA
jgi:hypothetical protein